MIHPAAIVDSAARVHETAEIGPFCIIGADVEIGARTKLMANVFAEGPLTIGDDNLFFPFSTAGVASQDLKYNGERAETRIGHRNKVREFVSIHRGTAGGGLITSIGDDNLLSAYSHVAHDVTLGSGVVMSHGATLGGHVVVGDHAVIGAYTGVHQFCRVGRYAFIGGYSVITQDVMPFSNTVGQREHSVYGANRVGLERLGFPVKTIEALQTSLRLLTRAGLNTSQALERIRETVAASPEIDELVEFILSSERGVIK